MSYYNPNFTQHFVSNESESKDDELIECSFNQWVLCAIYKLNKSGSKLATIGLDILNDCKPFVNIGNGSMSVTLTEKGWMDLMLYKDYFDYYFETGTSGECWDLDPSVKFYSSEIFKKRSVILHGNQRVVMQEVTWNGLKTVLPCIDIVLQQRQSWEKGVKKYVDSICQKLKEELTDYSGSDQYGHIRSKLNELTMPQNNDFFKHLHVELKSLCSGSIIKKVLSSF